MNKTCFFIGHHDTADEIYPRLLAEVEKHIVEYGVTTFYVGHYGNFDRMAIRAVKELKKRYLPVQLMIVLPYHPAISRFKVPDGCDGTYYPWEREHIPKKLAIIKTNQSMVDTCDYLIAYAWHAFGGAGKLTEYACKRETKGFIKVCNLADDKGL